MVNATLIASSALLVIGLTVTALMVLKAQYDANSGNYNTIGEICADLTDIEEHGDIDRLCTEFGTAGADLGLDDIIICGDEAKDESFEYMGDVEDYDGAYFTMREILEADDVEAKYDEVEARCLDEDAGRKLLVDYGWCSGNALFIAGIAGDSSNYCDPSQNCDSWAGGCGGSLSSCCITHDKCLQGGDGVYATNRCAKTDCSGARCDANLGSCAWSVNCSYRYKCGWWKCWGYDAMCGGVSSAITGGFGNGHATPQKSWNSGGANTHSSC